MIPTTTLTCKECGHTNESERIYCHNCGVKLDRSILPPEETLEETQQQVRKRVTAMVTPKSGFWAGSWISAIETICYALLVAAIVQMCRAPDEVPQVPNKLELTERPMIPMLINRAMQEPTSQRITIQEETANTYLRSVLKPAATGLIDKELKFLRIFVQFKPGTVQVTSEQSIFDWPLYARVAYKIQIAGGKLDPVCVGGSFGRMPIHPMIMNYADMAFQSVWDALAKERKLLDQMQSIEVRDLPRDAIKEIVLVTKPGRGL